MKYFKDDLNSLVQELESCSKGDNISLESKAAIHQVAAKREEWILNEREVRTMHSALPLDSILRLLVNISRFLEGVRSSILG